MAIKDNIEVIKQELSAQEQFLENAIKSERFIKKYKNVFIVAFIIVIGIVIYTYASDYMYQKKLLSINTAYSNILHDPNNKEAKDILQNQAPSLLALVEFKKLSQEGNISEIKALALKPDIDPLLSQIMLASINESNSDILSDYNILLKGYNLLIEKKVNEAKAEFAKISQDSSLQSLVKNIQHNTINIIQDNK